MTEAGIDQSPLTYAEYRDWLARHKAWEADFAKQMIGLRDHVRTTNAVIKLFAGTLAKIAPEKALSSIPQIECDWIDKWLAQPAGTGGTSPLRLIGRAVTGEAYD